MRNILRCELGCFLSKLARYSVVGSLSTLAVITLAAPNFSVGSRVFSNAVAIAQTDQPFSAEEIRNYARAVLGMEPRRQAAYEEIRSNVGDTVPTVVCNQNRSINQLRSEVRAIAVNYCTQAKAIIESNGLSISQFNDITQQQQSNAQLKQLIQNELLRLQQSLGN